MVHRPPDSRLLTNLLSQESAYSRALQALSVAQNNTLASLAAYAAASSPPTSRALSAVAGTLVAADAALRAYAESVEAWRAKLQSLKDAEDEVGIIVRDREILVNRLIKVSKPKSNRDSFIAAPSPSSHTNGSTASLKLVSGSKLEVAQTELQACEAHLAEKERLLDNLRASAISGGLHGRCKAMVECGWKWGEVGKEGLRALEDLALPNGYTAPDSPSSRFHTPLPDPDTSRDRRSSDISSSLSPSQSASQTAHTMSSSSYAAAQPASGPFASPPRSASPAASYRLSIPPAHAISDALVPPVLARRITEVSTDAEAEAGGSSVEEGEGEEQGLALGRFEVHENTRFGVRLGAEGDAGRGAPAPPVGVAAQHFATAPRMGNGYGPHDAGVGGTARSDLGAGAGRGRKRTVLGTLAGLFHIPMRSGSSTTSSPPPSPARTRAQAAVPPGRWAMRRRGREVDSSDDEVGVSGAAVDYAALRWKSGVEAKALPGSPVRSDAATVTAGAGAGGSGGGRAGGKRLKKTKRARSDVGAPVRPGVEQGGMSEGGMALGPSGTVKPKTRTKTAAGGATLDTGVARSETMTSIRSSGTAASGGGGKKKRRSVSGTTTPPRASSTPQRAVTLSVPTAPGSALAYVNAGRESPSAGRSSHHRAASLDHPRALNLGGSKETRSDLGVSTGARHGHGHGHAHAQSFDGGRQQASLMSIVEGVTRQNRDAWRAADPHTLLLQVRAPHGITDADLAGPLSAPVSASLGGDRYVRPEARRLSSASAPSLPLNVSVAAPTPAPRVPRAPLRSALRNRTPSPMSGPRRPPSPPPPMPVTLPQEGRGKVLEDDAASIASVETVFLDASEDAIFPPSPPPSGPPTPPPHDAPPPPPPPQEVGPESVDSHTTAQSTATRGSELSLSSASTTTPGPRRKSVRVSLQPTFSPTPPALEDEDDEAAHAPWADPTPVGGSGWVSCVGDGPGWDDSSEEDEEYARARHMLTRLGKKVEKSAQRKA